MVAVRNKLAYEWKNIYRHLAQVEAFPKGEGRVTFKSFQSTLSKLRVFLTKEELSAIYKRFEDVSNPETINYFKLSKFLGLHSNNLDLIRPALEEDE